MCSILKLFMQIVSLIALNYILESIDQFFCEKIDGAFYNILERSHCFLKLLIFNFFIIEKRFFDILFLL